MNYEEYLNTLSVANIKKIVSYYNKFVKIVASKKTKEELIQHLLSHTDYDMKTKNITIKKQFSNLQGVVKEPKPKQPKKPKEQPKLKEESKNITKEINKELSNLKQTDEKTLNNKYTELLNKYVNEGFKKDYIETILDYLFYSKYKFTPKETKPKETKPKETKPKETKPKETKPKETKPKETKPKPMKPMKPIEEDEPMLKDDKADNDIITANDLFIKIISQALKDSGYKFAQNRKKYEAQIKEIINKYVKPNLNKIKTSKDYDYYFKQLENNDFMLEHIKTSQKGQDFYPTPIKCVEVFRDMITKQRTILEPTAGLGFIVNQLRKINPEAQLTAIEYDTRFAELIKVMNPDVIVNPDNNYDFLKYNPDVFNQDMIFINPPFTNGKDSRYYMDFLFHCLYLLNRDQAGVLTDLVFISPDLFTLEGYDLEQFQKNKESTNIFTLDTIINNKLLSKAKLETILKRYNIPYTKKELDEVKKKGGDYNSLNERIDSVFGFAQGQLNGQCEEFIGTKIKVKMYHIIGYNLKSKDVIKKINLKFN